LLYKFLGKKGAFYQLDLEPINIKLNYRCKEGTVEEGSFSCGNTPEEAKKNYEKQQKEKAPAGKNNVPPTTNFNTKDIVSRIKNGGKITKAEYDFILPYINGSANKTSESTTGSATAKQSKQLPAKQETKKEKTTVNKKEKVTKQEKPLEIKAGSGLDKIRSEIKKAGGAEKFFKTADTHAKDQEERKPIDSEKMARIVNLYTESDTFKKPYKEENGVKWYEAKKDGNSIVIAKVGKKIAAYGLKATDPDDPKNPYTTIVASTDFTGKGYGKQAMLEFYDKNPDMIRKTGGLTPMGKKAYLKTLKTIAGE
jgi:hypothetical protein